MAWTSLEGRWWAEAALGGSIVLTLGSLAALACRQPAHRARVATLAVLGGLLAPWLGALPFAPRWSAGIVPAAPVERPGPRPLEGPAASPPIARRADFAVEPGRGATSSVPPASPRAAIAARPPAAPIAWAKLGLAAYGAGVAGLAAWWLVGQALILRVAALARPVDGPTRDRFLAISGPAGERVRLLASDRIRLPFTFTWARPTILIPSDFSEEEDGEGLAYALAHEWSHVERRDYRTWTLVVLSGLVLFYQPLFWWLKRQLRLCQDYLADDRAAALGSPEGYAAFLVRLARRRVAGPTLPALGIGDRRSNLHRRVVMLIQDREPWERRCRTLWGSAAALVAGAVIVAASGLRLDAAPAETPAQDPKEKPAMTKAEAKGERLEYSGIVKDKPSGKPIEGATVTVRRSILKPNNDNRLLQETKHTTDADGKYHFTIPPEQSVERSLYIELDVEAPEHASQTGFGYALGTIRKNEGLGGRPFFETIEMFPGKAISGRVQGADGAPAKGVKILAFSRTDLVKFGDPSFTMGSFTRATTDASGTFRVQVATPGQAVFWILPADLAPEMHPLPADKRGDLGSFVLAKGAVVKGRVLDAVGKPLAGIFVNADRDRAQSDEILGTLMVSDALNRSAVTDANGEFTLAPLPAGTYSLQPGQNASEDNFDRARRPLDDVFLAQKLTIAEGEVPEPQVIRAAPHVVIEAQWVDSKGQPTWGFQSHIFGRIDKGAWMGEAKVQDKGKVVAKVPHGLEEVQFGLTTNEHHAIKYRMAPGGPLLTGREIRLGTLDHDVRGIEIVHYNAPILTVKVQDKGGKPIPGLKVAANYAEPDAGGGMKLYSRGPLPSDVHFEVQEDGRHRSSQLSPDREFVVTAIGDGFGPGTKTLTLPEGKTEDLVLTLEPK